MENILEYLEQTEARYPFRTAVDDGDIRMTWRELVHLSRRMGTAFSRLTEPGRPVAILQEKSAIVLAAMFGVAYAGCFYVMIDPRQPRERMEKIFHTLEPEIIVTDEKRAQLLKEMDVKAKICTPRRAMQGEIDARRLNGIRRQSKGTDLLYGLFTSGSTGTPKGVVVSHDAVIRFLTHFTQIFEFTHEDRIGNQAPFDFDVSVKDIYASVITGAQLVLIPREYFSMPPRLLDYLCDREVTSLTWAVSALCLISSLKGLKYRVPKNVKRVLFSGEVMPSKQLRIWQDALPQARFVNLYGPTEITCNCTYYEVDRLWEPADKLPIGQAFPGREVFLIDEDGKRMTQGGVPGEICVAGESLAAGYYHNPEETAKRFVLFREEDGQEKRCYRTGDLGYYGPDGALYFAGRKDFQIKHMGHRIELEEIERSLEQLPGVARSCCLLDENKNQLIAFYVGEMKQQEIRSGLKGKVPYYMIPSKIVQVEAMPLNKNGKTDRGYFRKRLEG